MAILELTRQQRIQIVSSGVEAPAFDTRSQKIMLEQTAPVTNEDQLA